MDTVAEAAPADEARDALVATLAEALGDGLVASEVQRGVDVWVRVAADSWLAAGVALRDRCGMSYLSLMHI